jgi:hypothetical protein
LVHRQGNRETLYHGEWKGVPVNIGAANPNVIRVDSNINLFLYEVHNGIQTGQEGEDEDEQ